MKRLIILSLIPVGLFCGGVGLGTLIDHARSHHGEILAKEMAVQAKAKEIEAQQSAYWPTLDIGTSYTHVTPATIVSPKETVSGFLSAGVDLYDGGRKAAQLRAKRLALQSADYEKRALEKSITLQIIQYYYTQRKLQAILRALYGQSRELKAQLHRVRKFVKEGLATEEAADKLEAAYKSNRYNIENTKLMIETARENLSLLSGLSVRSIKAQRIKEPGRLHVEPYEPNKILSLASKSAEANAEAINAGYRPQVRLEDTYSRSHFSKSGGMPGFDTDSFLPDHQNKLNLSIHMRLFDHGRMRKESEALRYQKLALQSQYRQSLRAQKMHYKIAKKTLHTLNMKLRSAKAGLKAASSTYHTIVKKYEAGLVDEITYLDALNKKTLAEARYKESLYDYEIAKSKVYYYAGKDPREFIR
jgi:outer membrane protein